MTSPSALFAYPFKPQLRRGAALPLIWLSLGNPALAEIAAQARPAGVVIDLQHGLWERSALETAVGVAGTRTSVIARSADFSAIPQDEKSVVLTLEQFLRIAKQGGYRQEFGELRAGKPNQYLQTFTPFFRGNDFRPSGFSFNNFQIFDEEGHLLLSVGSAGRNPGEFLLPAGLYIDERDWIYVADQGNSRVQVFQYLTPGRK